MVKININNTLKSKGECYKTNLKIRRVRDYLKRVLQHTPVLCRIPKMRNVQMHYFERFFWAVSFIFANGIIYLLLSSQFSRFMEAPIITSVEKDYFNWNVSYPAIFLCPKNKVNEKSLTALVDKYKVRTGKNIEQYLRSIVSVSLDSIHDLAVPSDDIVLLINPDDYARICSELFIKFDNISIVTKWPITIEEALTEIGMCHIINSNVAVFDNPRKWADTEITYKKNNIELSFHDRDFFIQIENYADQYKVYTSSPDDVIVSSASSIAFNTAGSLSFGVHISTTKALTAIRSMPLSLRECRFLDEPNSDRYPLYSYNRCLIECRIKMISKLCGCTPHLYKPLKYEKICNLIELTCILNHNRDIITLSASNETLGIFNDNINIPRRSQDCGCLGDCEADAYHNDNAIYLPEESLNRLKISVASFPRVKFVRQIIFSFYDLFLKGGGVINLCTGTSVISIMEILLLVLKILIYKIIRSIQILYRAANT